VPLPRLLQGELTAATPLRNCYIVLEQANPVLAAVVRPDGRFTMRADSAAYAVTAVADTNYDGLIDLSGRLAPDVLSETVRIALEPAVGALALDSLFLP
jgi:hypothetical protein